MSDSNFSTAGNYSLEQFTTCLCGKWYLGKILKWKAIFLKVIGVCSSTQHIINFYQILPYFFQNIFSWSWKRVVDIIKLLLGWTGLNLTQATAWSEMVMAMNVTLYPCQWKCVLTGSWQACTSGIQTFPGLNGWVQLGWGVPRPHSFQFWQKRCFWW